MISVRTLRLLEKETIEQRLLRIVNYLAKRESSDVSWQINALDATGALGDKMTKRLNEEKTLVITAIQVGDLLREEGQIIELDLSYSTEDGRMRIIVRDGVSVDLLTQDVTVPPEVVGDAADVDSSLYNLP